MTLAMNQVHQVLEYLTHHNHHWTWKYYTNCIQRDFCYIQFLMTLTYVLKSLICAILFYEYIQ